MGLFDKLRAGVATTAGGPSGTGKAKARPAPSGVGRPPPRPRAEAEIPAWVMSSVMAFLAPCVHNEGIEARAYGHYNDADRNRDFLREAERNLRIPLDWRYGRESASESLVAAMHHDPATIVAVLDFALRNAELGYDGFETSQACQALDRALTEAGAAWKVVHTQGSGWSLQRRLTPTADAAAATAQGPAGNASDELALAYVRAHGKDPDPGAAYRHAVKAVEAAAIAVVSPNNTTATLGTVIGELRRNNSAFTTEFARDARRIGAGAADLSAVDVIVAQLDLLWANQTDRHSPSDPQPATPITQEQAEWALQLATSLVETFRSGWIRNGP